MPHLQAKMEILPTHRLKVVKMLASCLDDVSPNVSEMIESSLFLKNSPSQDNYYADSMQIIHNLVFAPSQMRHDIKNMDQNDTDALVFYDNSVFRSPELEAYIKLRNDEYMLTKAMLENRVEKASLKNSSASAMRCKACGSNDISAQQKQTRSADEGATVFFSCKQCNAKWKMN